MDFKTLFNSNIKLNPSTDVQRAQDRLSECSGSALKYINLNFEFKPFQPVYEPLIYIIIITINYKLHTLIYYMLFFWISFLIVLIKNDV